MTFDLSASGLTFKPETFWIDLRKQVVFLRTGNMSSLQTGNLRIDATAKFNAVGPSDTIALLDDHLTHLFESGGIESSQRSTVATRDSGISVMDAFVGFSLRADSEPTGAIREALDLLNMLIQEAGGEPLIGGRLHG